MANYKTAYGSKDRIDQAIKSGAIPPGTIILTDDTAEILFYDLEGKLQLYEEKYKFDCKEDVEEWIQKYPDECKGRIVSIHEDDKCNAYIINHDGSLTPIGSESGYNCISGGKAFRVIGVADNGDGTGVYTLNTVEGLEVDMQCYAQLAEARGDLETITAIDVDKKEITVSNYNPNAKLHSASPDPENFYENNYLLILGHPELGDIEVGFNANAEGEECIAHDVDSHSGGYASESFGKYSLAFGVRALSGYCAFALGYNVAALAVDSFAIGTGSKVTGYSAFGGGVNTLVSGMLAFGFGHNARAIKDYSIALGRYAWAYSKDQFVTGRYNFVDYNDKYAVLIGNGKSEIERSNAFMLDWEGNGYYAGDVYANSSNGEKVEENRLITKKELDDALKNINVESTWKSVQDIVRSGYGPTIYPVGTQFTVHHEEYGDLVFDVVAHNYLKKFLGFDKDGNAVVDENAPTMTLLSHNLIGTWSYEFDSAEKSETVVTISNNPVEITETIKVGTKCRYDYRGIATPDAEEVGKYFVSKIEIPKGKYAVIDDAGTLRLYENEDLTGSYLNLNVFAENIGEYNPGMSNYSDIITEYRFIGCGLISESNINVARSQSGSNNYKESGIRQFLNSKEEKGKWWSAQTKYDNPPSYANTKNGFLYGIDSDFLEIVGTVNLPCSGNGKYEQSADTLNAYTLQDKFYLPSIKEITGHTQGSSIDDGSTRLPYYQGASAVDMIKYDNNLSPSWWMLRTPHANYVNVKHINDTGNAASRLAKDKSAFTPMCTIV